MNTEDFVWLWKNRERALKLLSSDDSREAQANALNDRLKEIMEPDWRVEDAPHRIGNALRLAQRYGIELDLGTCFGDCRAILDARKWHNPISPNADVWSYGNFCKQKREEVTVIQGFSRWPELAICECFLNAKRAGVI